MESVIGDTGVTAVIAKEAKDAEYVFPLGDNVYKEHYTQRVIDWAKANKPPSRAAAIDFMRSNLIEHYEQCWVSSTHTERLVLDAIARGHFVNMRHAIVAIQSLVRRGLVILDPTPRLTNRSFELFVRQAERPDTLAKWREKLPRSSWAAARWPLLLAIPAGMIGLTVAAGQSGQSLTAIFTLLATGAPALVGVLVKSIRPAA